jgi:hypothetical protein
MGEALEKLLDRAALAVEGDPAARQLEQFAEELEAEIARLLGAKKAARAGAVLAPFSRP